MKIDLAVWTAVNGYAWQPGSVYSPKELDSYKNEIGKLDASDLPFGGLFLKDGKAVFWRTQIAPHMDSCGRGAVYCVVGAVPEEMASKVDFHAVFASSEVSKPQKPFPTSLELPERTGGFKSPLGNAVFVERRFDGVETFAELGGWCEEAKGRQLDVWITGSLAAPLFIVACKPRAVPPPPPPPPPSAMGIGARRELPARPHAPERADCAALRRKSAVGDSLLNYFACIACGFVLGVIVTATVCFWSFKMREASGNTPAVHDCGGMQGPSSSEMEHGESKADAGNSASEDAQSTLPGKKVGSAKDKEVATEQDVPSEARNQDNGVKPDAQQGAATTEMKKDTQRSKPNGSGKTPSAAASANR